MTTTEDVIRLAREAGMECSEHSQIRIGDHPGDWVPNVYHANFHALSRLIALAKAEEREDCAMICEAHRDPEEHVRASRRVDESLSSGTRDDQLRAFRHESEVRLYHVALNNAAASIRARNKEQT